MRTGVKLAEVIGTDPLAYELFYRVHATQRMFQRHISEAEVIEVLREGLIIEYYEQDLPFPSMLLNARTSAGRNVHLLVAMDLGARRLYIITVYDPDPAKWSDGFSRRKERK